MIKERKNGSIYMRSETNEKFINEAAALQAAQAMQTLLFTEGFSTYTSFYKGLKKLEVEAHFENNLPIIPEGYKSSCKEITSHEYYQDFSKEVVRCRTITFYFKY